MRRKALWITLALALVLVAGSAVLTARADDPAQDFDVEHGFPGPGDGCYCLQIYEPVVCKGPDGRRHKFPNICVAACSGYTKCERANRTTL